MTVFFLIYLLVFAFVALIFRVDFILVLVYLFIGVLIVSRWWGYRIVKSIRTFRKLPSHVFFGEQIPVQLHIQNQGLFPVVWLRFQESLPLELRGGVKNIHNVISLKPKGELKCNYTLEGRKRGIYKVGPTFISSGDIFGISDPDTRQSSPDFVVVYPKIIALANMTVPSHSSIGNVRYKQPINEDPNRVRGKREYVSGDSLKRIDWKATAISGKLQVKLYEPSIALVTAIFINLNRSDYEWHSRIDASELSITVAASISNWIISKHQMVGLYTNGVEPILESFGKNVPINLLPTKKPLPLPPRRERGHLMHILEVLAKVQIADTFPFSQLIHNEIYHLAWGTTIVIISPKVNEELFDCLFQASRAGINGLLIPCGPISNIEEVRKRAIYFGFPLFHILKESDLDIWRS